MKLTIFLEQRMLCSDDGAVWSLVGYDLPFWDRYLEVFSSVIICARVLSTSVIPKSACRVNGERVSVTPLPHYIGPKEYFRQMFAVKKEALLAAKQSEALIIRVPSNIGWTIQPFLDRTKRPYGVEVVGDPWDVFGPGGAKIFARPFFRRLFKYQLRKQCFGATAALYVTEFALQNRYPTKMNVFNTHASNVELPDSAFSTSPFSPPTGQPYHLIFVGTLEQLYKGPDVLIKSIALLRNRGLVIRITILGDGRLRANMEALVVSLSLENCIKFLGSLPSGKKVREKLDQAHVFVMPSLTEGLPRALLEAMARGLPCIGSAVGGIPELLTNEDLIPTRNVNALADKIQEVLLSPFMMSKMSSRNILKAREYSDQILKKRRIDFYSTLISQSNEWLNKSK